MAKTCVVVADPARARVAPLADYIDEQMSALLLELSASEVLTHESVHRLRVHGRRLARALGLAARVVELRSRALRELRSLVSAFSRLRDAQVVEHRVHGNSWSRVACGELRQELAAESRRHERRALRHLLRYDSAALEELSRAASALLRADSDVEAHAKPALAVLLGTVARAQLKAQRRTRSLDLTDARSLHRLRIQLRRYRYDAEALSHLLAPNETDEFAVLKRAQDVLGEAHDAHVTLRAVVRHSRRFRHAEERAWRLVAGRQLAAAQEEVTALVRSEQERLCPWLF